MGALAAIVPAIAGLAGGGLTSALGFGSLLGGFLPEVVGGGLGALSGGLINHSPLGAIEGAVEGGFGGYGGSGLASALGATPAGAVSGAAGALAGPIEAESSLATIPGGAASSFFSPVASALAPITNEASLATLPGGSASSFFGGSGAISPILDETSLATMPGGSAPSFFGGAGGSSLGAALGGFAPSAAALGNAPGALNFQSGLPSTPSGLSGATPTPAVTTEAPASSAGAPVQAPPAGTSNASATGSGAESSTSSGGMFGDVLKFLGKNQGLAQLALELGGVGASALSRPTIPGLGQALGFNPQSSLGQEVGTAQQFSPLVPQEIATGQGLSSGAQTLVNAPTSGTLPPGMAALYQQGLQDAQTAIRAKYANLGESGSTAEGQDLSAAEEREKAAMAGQLLQTQAAGLQQQSAANAATNEALSAAGLSDQIYSQIANIQLSSDQQLQNALAALAGASSGGARVA